MSPGETGEAFGWAPLVAMVIAIATSLLGYGASSQRNKRTAEDLEDIKKEHGAQIEKANAKADQVSRELADYREKAREKFVITSDLTKVEQSLSAQIDASQRETARKVEELRVEFGKKGIEHTIRTAVTSSLATALIELKRERAS